MTDIAARNRAIKKTLAAVFGRDKVTVRGSTGTAYGYARVHINHSPRNFEQLDQLRALCRELLVKANIDLGRVYTDDTCQSTCDEVAIRFNRCQVEPNDFPGLR